MAITLKLQDALLRRKELQGKVDVLKQIKDKDLFEIKARRQKITDDIDEIIASVPKLTASQVTAEYDFYARSLRKIDSIIQQMNWTIDVTLDDVLMADYKAAE